MTRSSDNQQAQTNQWHDQTADTSTRPHHVRSGSSAITNYFSIKAKYATVAAITLPICLLTACSSGHPTSHTNSPSAAPSSSTSTSQVATPQTSPTGEINGSNVGTVYVISNVASPDGSVQLASYSPTGNHKVITLAGFGSNSNLTVAPSGTPNVGTVFAYGPSSTIVAEIAPDGTVSRHDLGATVYDLEIAPVGTPNAGTAYASTSSKNAVTTIAPDGTVTSIPVGPSPGTMAIAPTNTPNAGTVYVADGSEGGSNMVTIISPDGTTSQVDVSAPPDQLTIVPGGINGTGTVYVTTRPTCDCADPAAVAVIDRDNSVQVISAGPYPTPVVICTNGPYAGDGYLLTGDKSAPGGLLRITPTGEMTTLAQTAQTGRIEGAPTGSTIDGTIYAAYNSNGITIVHPDGTLSTFHPTIPGAVQIDVTPTGIPGDGTVYIFAADNNHATILQANGTSTVDTFGDASRLHFALPGSPGAGTVYYVTDRSKTVSKLVEITLGGTRKTTALPFQANDLVVAP